MVRLSVRLELISNSTAGGTIHVTRQTLSNLFKGHTALSADMAIRFEKACGVKAGTSMRMQATNDGAGARGRERGGGGEGAGARTRSNGSSPNSSCACRERSSPNLPYRSIPTTGSTMAPFPVRNSWPSEKVRSARPVT
ncbi:MAG: helix-turn-helix domain-containing protein, partial [Phenylobacterium sp.]|nr:helix-turn-helix domain-containing protein [Phenylobacterium sp.]